MTHKEPFKVKIPSEHKLYVCDVCEKLLGILKIHLDFNYLYFSGEFSGGDPMDGKNWNYGHVDFVFNEDKKPEIDFSEFLSFIQSIHEESPKENSFNQYDEHEAITRQMSQIYREKNADYGDSFNKSLNKHGMIAAVVRIEDKFLRFENIVKTGKIEVKSESLEDTLIDMANYCIMSVIHLRSKKND